MKSENGHQPDPTAQVPSMTKKAIAPSRQFRQDVTNISASLLVDWVGEDQAKEAIGRIASAFSTAAASAKNPADFYACTPASVGGCIAISALTGMMPGNGSTALAYLIPRRPRANDPPQLKFELSHRGLNALARRCGQTMIPIPISRTDKIEVGNDGDVRIVDRDIDNPPTSIEELRGVAVVVKQLASGIATCTVWVPRSLIIVRRNSSESYKYALANAWAQEKDPWHKWPVEQSMKTGMHYTIARGYCVIDDTASARAMTMDQEVEIVRDRIAYDPAVGSNKRDPDALSVENPDGPDFAADLASRIADIETPDQIEDMKFSIQEAQEESKINPEQAADLDAKLAARCNELTAETDEAFALGKEN